MGEKNETLKDDDNSKQKATSSFVRRWRSWDCIEKINFILFIMALFTLLEIGYVQYRHQINRFVLEMTTDIKKQEKIKEQKAAAEKEELRKRIEAFEKTQKEAQEAIKKQKEEQKRLAMEEWNKKKVEVLAEAKKVLSEQTNVDSPRDCTDDDLKKIKKSGLSPSGCTGAPWLQACSHTILTRNNNPTWLQGYSDELKDIYKSDGAESFLALFQGCNEGINAFSGKSLFGLFRGSSVICVDKDQTKIDAATSELENVGLDKNRFTSHVAELGATDVGPKESVDHYMTSLGKQEAFVDYMYIASSFDPFFGSLMTLTRTRYVSFMYGWDGDWKAQNFYQAIDLLDELNFSCYWAGEDKVWRINGCFQDHYEFHTWSYVACSNRVLAPKLTEKMESMFKATAGIE